MEEPMRGDHTKNEADELGARLGKELRKMFSDIAAEPLPPRLARLVSRLDDAPPAGGASARPAIVEGYDEDICSSDCRASGP
jgi:Anti-sigma factor NepR